MTNKDTPQSNTDWRELEQLSEKIHHLYCEQYIKDNGKPYWTNGDYSLLDERTKEYDRNIARFISQLLEAEKKRWREEVESMRTYFVPADSEWFGAEDYSEGSYRLVPAKDPQKAMYCLTCERFLHEEGCTCGTVTIDAVLQKLS